ncbi:YbaL family putative K(+) efflux transporter [Thorsellia anophelis]|uniref:Monovalent cation:H+ antiporter-2, CPA2 family n=1 Tax=Thorsellia anophelis DSM 18579 TaxID=1123402 RepID=A0A1I0C281_9GAMM|nr:YbaL family putative K(+) efflux transporter [Thorsellia anophelis]SET13188.1 monovalent cation:H+ antiporter-2, CPA2 family [Thorsellia anophelis DSM 18579]
MHAPMPLISTMVGGLVLAFILGMLAHRVKISPLVGYLAAGIIVGPFTPGYVADLSLAPQLAELGVIMLMFGVGLHFSINDLLAVKHIAIPGAILQIAAATLLGFCLGQMLGWSLITGILFGLCLSTASTVVLLRAMEERQLITTKKGKIAIGWLVVEDLVMVLALVLFPVITEMLSKEGVSPTEILYSLIITLTKVIAFIAFMLIIGKRVIPWLLIRAARTDSDELFTLAVLAISIGIAFGAVELFDVSFALGAFFAGVILNGTEFSHRATNNTLPLRDAFAVLFFVSVGMLFNPAVILESPFALIGTLFIILLGKSIIAYGLVRFFKHSKETALTVSISLAQIGEFAFILAGLGLALGIADSKLHNLVLAGAILSISINPFLFTIADKFALSRLRKNTTLTDTTSKETAKPIDKQQPMMPFSDHIVIVGYGIIGQKLLSELNDANEEVVIVDHGKEKVRLLKMEGHHVILGDGISEEVLTLSGIAKAKWLFITLDNPYETAQIMQMTKSLASHVKIVTYGSHLDEIEYLYDQGAYEVIEVKKDIAITMASKVIPSL